MIRPHLRFRIERHGGTVMGSTRAEVQLDIERGVARIEETGRRQSTTAGCGMGGSGCWAIASSEVAGDGR